MGDAVEFIKEDGSILEVDVQKAAAPRPSNSLPMPKRIDGPDGDVAIKNPPVKNIESDISKATLGDERLAARHADLDSGGKLWKPGDKYEEEAMKNIEEERAYNKAHPPKRPGVDNPGQDKRFNEAAKNNMKKEIDEDIVREAHPKVNDAYKIKPDPKSPPHSEFRSPHPVKKAEGDYKFKHGSETLADRSGSDSWEDDYSEAAKGSPSKIPGYASDKTRADTTAKHQEYLARKKQEKAKVNSALKKALQVIVPALQEEMMADIEKARNAGLGRGGRQQLAEAGRSTNKTSRKEFAELHDVKELNRQPKTPKFGPGSKEFNELHDVDKMDKWRTSDNARHPVTSTTPKQREKSLRNNRLNIAERVLSNPNRTKASLSVKKAISIIEGYSPMTDADVMKSFNGLIPDVMKEVEMRPPTTWWNEAVTKTSEFEEFPAKVSMDLWYNTQKSGDEELSKAVAENLTSSFQPKKTADTEEADGSRLKVSDLNGPNNSKSETDVSN